MGNFSYLQGELDHLRQIGRYRQLNVIESPQGAIVKIAGKEKIAFCSNNYLSLASHPKIIEAIKKSAEEFGYGSAASRLVSGTMSPHFVVEREFSSFFRTESALLYPSGWTANYSLITTLPQKGDLLLLDKLDHASIIDAARSSEAEFKTYRRGNMEKIEKYLGSDKYNRKFIITESIFSMDGDTADIKELVRLKKDYDAFLIVDEAHSAGCMGDNGAGLCEKLGVLDDIDIIVATMSKAFGANGGIVAGPKLAIDYLINKSRGFIYTTAVSPINCSVILAAMDIVKSEPQRRIKLEQNARYLRNRLEELGLNTADSSSYIIPVIIGPEDKTLFVSQRLYEEGFFIPAIRPPTVAPGTCRLRISLQADHTIAQIESLCEAISRIIKEL